MGDDNNLSIIGTNDYGVAYGGAYASASAPSPSLTLEQITDEIINEHIVSELRMTDEVIVSSGMTEDQFKDRVKAELTQGVFNLVKDKIKFTKLYCKESRSTKFKAKVYVYTEEELKELIKKCYNS